MVSKVLAESVPVSTLLVLIAARSRRYGANCGGRSTVWVRVHHYGA